MKRLTYAFITVGMLLSQTSQADDSTYTSSPYIGLRYRDSTLHSDAFGNTGHAHTLRLQLGYLWALTPQLAVYAEGTRVWSLFGKQYNDTTGRRTPYPAEPDPPSTELSSAWLGYDNGQVGVRAGRQYLHLDNNRFFSVNAWRQNPQSFDGVTSYLKLGTGTTLSYDWLDQVNRTVGADFPDIHQRRWKLNGQLLHLDQALPLGQLSAYGYFVKNRTLAANSVRTVGARWSGHAKLQDDSPAQLSWTVEAAHQDNYSNNPQRFSLPYHLLELGYGLPEIAARLGEESLGGNGRTPFNIAYGSGHSFDGWVGVFSIPPHGLRDRYGGLYGALPWQTLTWQLTLHQFQPVSGTGSRYGHEVDAGVRANLNARFSLELQYGDYHANSFSMNQRKLWLLAEYRFGKQAM
ncbi:alginate export family protein [Dyella silvatica]|uniref:alginate export family protein n=1 Tax=Dyella silvatica TaxID=2992128 RepID=UPI0022530239|nr:alginate export family protein [Dyella silvatica]